MQLSRRVGYAHAPLSSGQYGAVTMATFQLHSTDAASKYLHVPTLLGTSCEYLDGLGKFSIKITSVSQQHHLISNICLLLCGVTMVTRPDTLPNIPVSMRFPESHGAALPLRLTRFRLLCRQAPNTLPSFRASRASANSMMWYQTGGMLPFSLAHGRFTLSSRLAMVERVNPRSGTLQPSERANLAMAHSKPFRPALAFGPPTAKVPSQRRRPALLWKIECRVCVSDQQVLS